MRTARLTAIVAAASVVLLSLPAAPSVADEVGSDQTIIVTLDTAKGDTAQQAEDAVAAAGGTVSETRAISDRSVAVTVADASAAKAQAIGEAAADLAGVTAAQPSRRAHSATTDDTYYSDLWNLNNASDSTYGVDAEDAWPTSTGSGVVVGVIDTGMTKHSDLSSASNIVGGNVIAGYDLISDPTYSGDEDGVDDNPTDEGGDSDWHGTHVAGIIAAIKDNHKGVVGVAPSASIEPLRVLGTDGSGSEEDIIAAISWGAGLSVDGVPPNPNPASVLNLSLSGGGYSPVASDYACSTAMQVAIDAAVAKGVAIVVAAGNDGDQLRYSYPANCNNVIRVTATTKTGALADYSNYGTTAYPATVAAPGDDIWSTYNKGRKHAGTESYAQMSGTSMAAPHVSGVIALLKAANPSLTVAQIVGILTSTAKPVADCSTTKCGAGIVEAADAVAAADSAGSVTATVTTPTISGTPKVGSVLTASVGSYSPSGAKVSWQWLRNGKDVAGATSSIHTADAVDKDAKLSVRATVRYFDATATATSSTVTVAGLTFTSQAKPKISGTYKVGHKLTVKVGTVKPSATGKSYQWLRNGKAIANATHSTYRLVKADRKKKISVTVTVSRAGYVSRSATSSAHKVK